LPINIGNGIDQVTLNGQLNFNSNSPIYSTNPQLYLNTGSTSNNSSDKSGIYITDNGLPDAGYLRMASNFNGYNFKAPNNNSLTAYNGIINNTLNIDVNSMTLQGNSAGNKFNQSIGINGMSNGIVTLTRSSNSNYNATDASYTLTVSQIDTSNILIRDSNSSNDTDLQSILTRLTIVKDVSINSRLFVGGDVSMSGNLTVSSDVVIMGRLNVFEYATNTTLSTVVVTNYRALIVNEDIR
jgi:hypothetical protein